MNYSSKQRPGANRGGPGKGRNKTSSNAGNQASQSLEGLYSNDRLVSAVTSVLGCTAKVTEKNGKQFEGVFKTISPQASLVLGKANQVEEQVQNGVVDGVLQKPEIFEQFVMHPKDWVRVEFKDVNLEEYYLRKQDFKTDAAIGGNKRMNGQRGKELEKWEPGDIGEPLETTGLEGQHSTENGWSAEEMFERNETVHGVTSTYDESMEEYTTKLVKSDTPEYRERERMAEQKAKEILKESTHERNAYDSGRSEEQLYSAVVRNRSSSSNWRQPNSDRPPEREHRTTRLSVRKEPVKSQQTDEATKVQVKEKIEKPGVEAPVECKPGQKVEAFSDIVKPEPKSTQNVSQTKTPDNPTNTSVAPLTSTHISTEPPQDPTITPEASTPTPRSQEVKDLKDFATNFQLGKEKKTSKVKKVTEEEEEKTSNEAISKEEKDEEVQTSEEVKADSEPNDKKKELNPNAQEFRPRAKRNTASPRSNNTPSSSGAQSPFQGNSSFSAVYPTNSVYSRSGPRGRGMRQDYMEPTPGYINASNAAGQPLFAHHMPPQFIHQPSPTGIPYINPGNMRHPALQPPVFIQPHPHQGPVVLPVGQMPPPHYSEVFYGPAMPLMQSPPQITSPSLQQSQFNFPPPAMAQPVNQVRPVSQPPAVIPQQPSAQVLYVRNSVNEIQPTQIMNRPPFQGN